MKYPDDFINKIICGDCLEVMKEMPDGCVDMVITSPPYWGLRDYGVEQIFGGDPNCEHDFNVSHRRRNEKSGNHGNMGYIGAAKSQDGARFGQPTKTCSKCKAWKGQLGLEPTPEFYIEHLTEIFSEVKRVLKKGGTLWLNIGDTYGGSGGDHKEWHKNDSGFQGKLMRGCQPRKMMPKCLMMIPERLAWSLIQDGWILRNKIIWYKPNSMPSSVTDRFSNRYEFIYMFSNQQKYYFDLDAVREAHVTQENRPFGIVRNREWDYDSKENLLRKTKIPDKASESFGSPRARYNREGYKDLDTINPLGKNPGDVFEINTQPFPEAHFAVFPEKLCEKPIKAGCPEDGIVLDPFCGAGTTLYVAKEMKRRYIGIDIKQEFKEMSDKRLTQGVL